MLKSLFNKAAGPQACNFIKKETPTRVFPREISKNLKNIFFKVNQSVYIANRTYRFC